MALDGSLIYRQYWDKDRSSAPRNVMVSQMLPRPRRAVLYSWWKRRWMFDPMTLHNTLMEDSKDGGDRLTLIDRETAESVARSFGQELPSEAELLQMMEQGAAEMYATDNRMKYVQLYDDDPGANWD
jgi:hypothetical protein